jgi:YrbI family 3-deoxy-D-manno-octulosonate 8-phosphate phosphatase
MLKTISIIPARGGSKGLPRKNVLPICGKPLLAWNIEAAMTSKQIDDVYVSTDDPEIAQVARSYGAKVIDRPIDLAGDAATSESALLHGLDFLSANGVNPELLVFMQCTSPLTATEDIDCAINTLYEMDADSCLTASDFHYFVWNQNKDGFADGINHDKRFRPRRQDREPQYAENGAIYVMKVDGFREAQHRFFGKTVLSLMPAERCAEIDEPVDLKVVEVLLREQLRKKQAAMLPDKITAVAFDFDGVMTDNRVWVDQDGKETVACDRSDGWGLSQLKKSGIRIAVLSTEINPVVSARCKKLGLECRQGLGEKKFEAFQKWCAENQFNPAEVVFVGNDANDVDCLRAAGCGVVPADAYPEAKAVANVILEKPGGYGAVRELCELISTTI